MSLNFAPKRDELSREIELCITANRLDTLNSLCNGCLYAGQPRQTACATCTVQMGRERILKRIH